MFVAPERLFVAPEKKGTVLDAIRNGTSLVLPRVNGGKEMVFLPGELIVNGFDSLSVMGKDTETGEGILLEFKWSATGNHAQPLTRADHQ